MRFVFLFVLAAGLVCAQSSNSQVLQRYLQARQDGAVASRSFGSADDPNSGPEDKVEVQIEASLPKLQKSGTMRGLRAITRAGQVVYSGLRFSGDKLISRDVISRYLAADVQKRTDQPDQSLTDRNYRFEGNRQASYNGRDAVVFQVTPKSKRPGLFRGELWLDSATALPLREWGDFVKSPSRFLSHPRFVRDYTLAANQARPRRLILSGHASFVGDVEMTIWFSSEVSSGQQAETPTDAGESVLTASQQ